MKISLLALLLGDQVAQAAALPGASRWDRLHPKGTGSIPKGPAASQRAQQHPMALAKASPQRLLPRKGRCPPFPGIKSGFTPAAQKPAAARGEAALHAR